MIDPHAQRIQLIRWYVLLAAHAGRPYPVAEPLVLSAIQAIPLQCTALELRQELDYLEDRGLIELARHEAAHWTVDLTRAGVDIVEYTVPVEPGIARPQKYWKG